MYFSLCCITPLLIYVGYRSFEERPIYPLHAFSCMGLGLTIYNILELLDEIYNIVLACECIQGKVYPVMIFGLLCVKFSVGTAFFRLLSQKDQE